VSSVVSVDVGGTFTDVSIMGDTGLTMTKVRTTGNPVDGVLEAIGEGLRLSGAAAADVTQVLHATTAATNAIFERKGAKTAYVTTEGFGDVVLIGREVRSGPERFQITLPKPDPFVAEDAIFELPERMQAAGKVLTPLDDGSVGELAQRLTDGRYETVAVSLFHSYRNPVHEQRVRELLAELAPGVRVMLSSDVCPEPGEYERAMTTIVCAYLAPLVDRYIDRLQAGLAEAGIGSALVIIGSDGAGIDADELRRRPIASLESGPVAGVMAAKSLMDDLDIDTAMTLDIGGTTSKAGVIVDGRIELTKDFRVGGPLAAASRRSASAIPVRMPVVDLAEIGIGGGSIAWTDAAGLLRVGPQSAGADPGPACFDTGGDAATVTDAAVVTGIIEGRPILGTDQLLDADRARQALADVGKGLGLDPVAAAVAVRGVASAEIAAAVQRQLFYRGIDPRDLALIAFGGTGPLHGAEVAEIVGTRRVLVPRAAGVFTTFGLLSSEIGMERIEHARIFVTGDGDQVETTFERLEFEARQLLGPGATDTGATDTGATDTVRLERTADVRFRHQVQTMPLNLPDHPQTDAELAQQFKDEYHRQFGLVSDDDVEVVQLRVRAIAAQARPPTQAAGQWSLRSVGTKQVHFVADQPEAVGHAELVEGPGTTELDGPAVVDLVHTSVTVPAGWRVSVFGDGDLSLDRLP